MKSRRDKTLQAQRPPRGSLGAGGLLLLADAGATHTRAVVATPEGAIVGWGRAGPANAFAVGEAVALSNLFQALRRAQVAARARPNKIAAVVVGSASVGHDGSGSASIGARLRQHYPRAHRRVLADSLIALEGALMGGAGVVILSGTGSVVLGKRFDYAHRPERSVEGRIGGKLVKVGGWGPLLGDEGSAQWIGRKALQAAARAADGTGPRTSMLATLKRHFHLKSFAKVVDVVYASAITPADLGALAPLVAQAARHGDRVARDLFRRAGEALALQAAQAARQVGLLHPRVSYQGSMFRVGGILLEPLRRSLREFAPRSRLVTPAMAPLGGAFLLALAGLSHEARLGLRAQAALRLTAQGGERSRTAAAAAFRRNCRA